MHKARYMQNRRADRQEHINKGHRQHEHDKETDILCNCSAKETKRNIQNLKKYAASPLQGEKTTGEIYFVVQYIKARFERQ